MPNLRRPFHCGLLALLGLAGCENFEPPTMGDGPGETPAAAAPAASPPSSSPAGTTPGDPTPADSKGEASRQERKFTLGQSGSRHVFVPNPEKGSITVINAESLKVTHVRAGTRPSLVGTHADQDLAVAIDTDGDRAYILDAEELDSSPPSVAVRSGFNAIEVHPEGTHAVLYYSERYTNPTGVAGPTQAIAVLTLASKPRMHDVNVQQSPEHIVFSADGERAYVYGERGVCRLVLDDLDEGEVRTVSPWDFDGTADSHDVLSAVAVDGDVALLSLPDEPSLVHVDLATQQTLEVSIPELDAVEAALDERDNDAGILENDDLIASAIAISGDGEYALVTLPTMGALLQLQLQATFEDGEARVSTAVDLSDTHTVHLGENGKLGIVIDNGRDPPRLTSLDLTTDDDELRELTLNAAALAPVFGPDGEALVITHDDKDSFFGYTVVIPDDGNARFRRTTTRPDPPLLSRLAASVFALTAGGSGERPTLEQISLDGLNLTEHALPAGPLVLGEATAAERLVIQHEHPSGRITTLEWQHQRLKQLTGFQLVDRIKE